MNNWYILYNGQQIGPMSENELLAYNPTPDTMVWHEGLAEWQPVYNFPSLMARINEQANLPRNPNVPPAYAPARTDKDKIVAGLLAIFLGFFGVQYFYIGKTSGGIYCLLLSIVTCGIWEIVSFIHGILMLTMSQRDFEDKYVLSRSGFPLF